jgi:hypothetical protein
LAREATASNRCAALDEIKEKTKLVKNQLEGLHDVVLFPLANASPPES